MRSHDAEKLLGGYATGTLTETERRDLFAAALEHQALFDALADEEALRELLADPAARAELLAVLAEGPAPKVVPFWRRHPGALGLAASLLIAVTAGVAYLRSPQPPPTQATPKAMEVAPQPEPPALTEDREAPLRKGLRPRQAPKELPTSHGGPIALPESAAPAAPSVAAGPPAPPPPAPEKAKTEAFSDAARVHEVAAKEEATAKRAERKAAQPPAASAQAVAGGAPEANRTQDQLTALPMGRALGATASLAPGVVASPAWSFEPRKGGGWLLRVHHLPGTYPILLRRTSTGAVQVAQLRDLVTAHGHRVTTFPLPADPGPMDLYVLPTMPPDPPKLPTEGPIQGFRARVQVPGP